VREEEREREKEREKERERECADFREMQPRLFSKVSK
jgi:hypothetical protein